MNGRRPTNTAPNRNQNSFHPRGDGRLAVLLPDGFPSDNGLLVFPVMIAKWQSEIDAEIRPEYQPKTVRS